MLSSIKYEFIDSYNHSVKFVFKKPIVFGVKRNLENIELFMYNLASASEGLILSEFKNTPFSNSEVTYLNDGTPKLTFKTQGTDNFDIHVGADGKTLRIKYKLKVAFNKPIVENVLPNIVIPPIKQKSAGKRYVLIDPGHGGSDVGATRDNIYEKDITLDISKRVEKLLKKKGYIVEITQPRLLIT